MAQTRLISELVELITPNNEDVFVIVDNTTNPSLGVTKQISYASLKEDLQDVVATLTSGGTGINASYNDLNNTLTISVVDDTTTQRTIVSSGGGEIGTRKEINFIAGTAATVSGADNSGENRVDVTIGVDASQISINDLSSASPLEVTKGGTGGSTASVARGNLGAAKAGSNSDITALTGLTTALSISQGGTGADTAQQALKGIGGLKYITDVGVGGESLVVNDTVEVANEFRGEIKGIKAGDSTISVTTDGTDIAVTANPDDILGGATQNVSLNNYRLTNVASPVGATDAANRAYVDQVSAGLSIKEAVVAATTTNIASTYAGSPAFTLTVTGTGVPSLDGVNITSIGTRVLVKDQTTATQNGIYELTTAAGTGVSAVFTRTDDANSSAEVKAGIFMFVQNGTTNGNLQFTQVTNAPALDTDPLVFSVLNDATIADNSVTNLKLSDMTALTIKGAVSSGNPQDLTPNQVLGILNSGTTKLTSNVLSPGTTAVAGIVQLYNNVDSTSSGLAATANAVRTAYNLAAGAIPISGGTFTGHVSGTTAPVGTNTTQLATTAFVNSEIANDAPTKTGGGATGTWDISISGNAGTASALASGVSIGLAGDLSGSAIFDGSSSITITGAVADDSHNHVISNVDGLQTALDAKAPIVNAVLSGTPTAPTASAGTATTQIATTAFVDAAISGVTGGAVTSANKLTTARTITLSGDVGGSVSFDGSQDVTIAANIAQNSVALGTDTTGNYVASAATAGSGISGSVATEGGVFTVTSNATPASISGTIVSRDANGSFAANVITASLSGNASTANTWASGRTITLSGDVSGSVSIDGSQNVTIATVIQQDSVALGTDTTGSYVASATTNGSGISGSVNTESGVFTVTSNATNLNTAETIVFRDVSGNFSAGTVHATLSGTANNALAWTSGRTITLGGDLSGNVTIDGSQDVTLSATIAGGIARLGSPQIFTAQQTFTETADTVYTLTGTDINPANGGIQTKTLFANVTFTESLESGQSVLLMLTNGLLYTVNWPTVTWVGSQGNIAPILTNQDAIVFWQVNGTVYAAYLGSYV